MASREIRDLAPPAQVAWNKFNDRCRRDTELLKAGITVLLLCTHRSESEQEKLYEAGDSVARRARITEVDSRGPASMGFEVQVLWYGRPAAMPDRVKEHAAALGLRHVEYGHFEVK